MLAFRPLRQRRFDIACRREPFVRIFGHHPTDQAVGFQGQLAYTPDRDALLASVEGKRLDGGPIDGDSVFPVALEMLP